MLILKNIIRKQLYVVITLLILLLAGCSEKPAKQDLKENNNLSIIKVAQVYYTPLDSEKFSSIINDEDHLSGILISYSKSWTLFKCGAGQYNGNLLLSSLVEYNSEIGGNDGNPPQSFVHNHKFSAAEVQDIFDYLALNSDYFFNGEEYDGLYPPIIVSDAIFEPVCNCEFMFTLQVGEPNQNNNLWSIHKCVDEYPSPDSPLYGLFQLLENDFISQFE